MRFEDLKEYCVMWEYEGDITLSPINNRVILCPTEKTHFMQVAMNITKSGEELKVTFSNGSAVTMSANCNYFEAYLHGNISQINPKEPKGLGEYVSSMLEFITK